MRHSVYVSSPGRLAAIVVAAVTASVVLAQITDPLEILRRNITARGTVTYSGVRTVVVFEDGRKLHGVEQQVQCAAPHRTRIRVIAPAEEAGRLCVINGQVHWEYDPASARAVRAYLPPPDQVLQQRLRELESIASRMRLQYCGVEEIAGRPAYVVKVYTAQGVPVKKQWIDTQRWVTLKTQRFDSRGVVKSSAYFTRITFDPPLAPGLFEFEPPPHAAVIEASRPPERMSLAQAEQLAGFSASLPKYLPAGYRFLSDRVAVIHINGRRALWLPFSNGADTFSLFQQPSSSSGAAVRRGRSITWVERGYRFTLMGPLSTAEMQRVKSSIHP
ncbi:MAG: outer membrane lipoprotein carrier protein LolA [Armatimonadota bacterium]